jgi:ABC-2 type transport system ATP-binding protein
LVVPHDGSMAALRDVLTRLDTAEIEVASLSLHTPDLDDVFLALTGRSTADPNADGSDRDASVDSTDRATKEPVA